VVQANSATAEESAAAAQELSAQAHMLESILSQFKLKEGVGASEAFGARPAVSGPQSHDRASEIYLENGFDKY
jgi:hypothetical protein